MFVGGREGCREMGADVIFFLLVVSHDCPAWKKPLTIKRRDQGHKSCDNSRQRGHPRFLEDQGQLSYVNVGEHIQCSLHWPC